MRKLTTCPRCEEEYLSVIRLKDATTIRCVECGWHHDFMPKPEESELVRLIAEVVAKEVVGG
jgi:uncharacterized Zn finger protein